MFRSTQLTSLIAFSSMVSQTSSVTLSRRNCLDNDNDNISETVDSTKSKFNDFFNKFDMIASDEGVFDVDNSENENKFGGFLRGGLDNFGDFGNFDEKIDDFKDNAKNELGDRLVGGFLKDSGKFDDVKEHFGGVKEHFGEFEDNFGEIKENFGEFKDKAEDFGDNFKFFGEAKEKFGGFADKVKEKFSSWF